LERPGFGGSFGFADPEAKIGYGYVLNRQDTYFTDPRDVALRTAMYRSIGEIDPYHENQNSLRLINFPKYDLFTICIHFYRITLAEFLIKYLHCQGVQDLMLDSPL